MKWKGKTKIKTCAECARCIRTSGVVLGFGFFVLFWPEIEFRIWWGSFSLRGTQNRSKSRFPPSFHAFWPYDHKNTQSRKNARSREVFKRSSWNLKRECAMIRPTVWRTLGRCRHDPQKRAPQLLCSLFQGSGDPQNRERSKPPTNFWGSHRLTCGLLEVANIVKLHSETRQGAPNVKRAEEPQVPIERIFASWPSRHTSSSSISIKLQVKTKKKGVYRNTRPIFDP